MTQQSPANSPASGSSLIEPIRDRFTDVSLAQWLALTPHERVAANLNIKRALLDAMSVQKHPVVPPSLEVAS